MTPVRIIDGTYTAKTYKPGLTFPYRIAIPETESSSYALLVEHDGQNNANVHALLRLAEEGAAPYTVSIGVSPGYLIMPDGTTRDMRLNSYDLFDREYSDFLVYELIPHITDTYAIVIDPRPEYHIISGGSSGGISAFCAAWFHPEVFRCVYMSSPSFLAMGRGNEIPYLIRKYETKPLRIYEEYSENEPNDYFGGSYAIDIEARDALTFAGYDFTYVYFPGEGHCSQYRNEDSAYVRMKWLLRNEPITYQHSPRVNVLLPEHAEWKPADVFPVIESPTHAQLSPLYRHVVPSADGLAWYAADPEDDIIYQYINRDRIRTEDRLLHAMLHTIPRTGIRGAIDMAVDKTDRLYVLTSIGIQCVRAYGLIDIILGLPDNTEPLAVAVTDALYVKTAGGCYKRALHEACTAAVTERRHISYYD